jgi:hypothetical protein
MTQASTMEGAKAMGNEANRIDAGRKSPWRAAAWGLAALVLLTPLAAMQFTRDVAWTVGDFIFAGLMIGLVGIAYELAVRASGKRGYRAGVAVALGAAFLTIWANGAVGMIGNEDNPYNLMFLAVIGVGLIGSVLARFRPMGMAIAMFFAAFFQGVVAAGGIAADPRGGTLSACFALIWLLAGALFRNAAEDVD